MHGLVVLACGLLFSAPSLDDVNRAVRSVLADHEIQTEYPGQDESPAPTETREIRDRPPSSRAPRDRGTVVDGSAFASTLLWVLAGVGAVLLVIWLARGIQGRAPRVEVEDVPAVAVPRAPPAAAELADAAALAAEGRYEEAVHHLLLHALRDVEGGGGTVSSDTSREVVRRAALAGDAREAVMALVGAVELSHFGGRPVDEAGYLRSVEHYRRFQAARA